MSAMNVYPVYGVIVSSWEEVEAFVKTHNIELYNKLIVPKNNSYAREMSHHYEFVKRRRHQIVNKLIGNERPCVNNKVMCAMNEEELNQAWKEAQEERRRNYGIDMSEAFENKNIIHNIGLHMFCHSETLIMSKFIIGIKIVNMVPNSFAEHMMTNVVTMKEYEDARYDNVANITAEEREILCSLGTLNTYAMKIANYWANTDEE